MKNIIFSLLAVCFLSACSQAWIKPGASNEEFYRDSYQCERDAAMIPYPSSAYSNSPSQPGDKFFALSDDLTRLSRKNQLYDRCMQSKGWKKE